MDRMRLSKSRYTAGLQCHRQLWWRVHEPDAPELSNDGATQAVFDQGTEVGRVARERVPGGVLIGGSDEYPLTSETLARRVEETRQALESQAPAIYEASFFADETFAAVDILERIPGGWALIEVKSTTRIKAEHIPDVAVQLHVLRRSGLTVPRAELMHLNRACTFPRLNDLFTRDEVTAEAEALLPHMPGEIGRQLGMLRGPVPAVPIGPHCDSPYECPFKGRCWPPLPEHHISTLYYVGIRRWELEAQGIRTIHDVPDDFELHPAAARQRRSIRAGTLVVDPGLGEALAGLEGPLAVLDFESVSPAIPVWNGCHPYDPVPAQFSCHFQNGGGRWRSEHWIAEGAGDPRPELVRRVARACEGARTILAYHADYERYCLYLISEALPELKETIEGILARLVDALPLVRDYVYHPGFGGSFGLKSVLPALVPELGYGGMEIADGMVASGELRRLLLADGMPDAERARVREALRRYCELDTLGVVKLLERLEILARTPPSAS